MSYLHAFDMHGTLVKGNEGAIAHILGLIIASPSRRITKEEIATMMGWPLNHIIRSFLLDTSNEKIEELVARFRELSIEVTCKYLYEREGARSLLAKIKDREDMVAIVTTTNTRMAEKMLEWLDMRRFCDHICGGLSGDIAGGKAEHIKRIALEILPSRTYMVGDRVEDMEAGRKVGAITVLIRSSATPAEVPQADYEISNLEDYFRIISSTEVKK